MISNNATALCSDLYDRLDDWQTPSWATRSLCEWLAHKQHEGIDLFVCREPAANRGSMVRPLAEYFAAVEPSDVHDYGVGFAVQNYLTGPLPSLIDWTITNPPLALAEQFIARALATSRQGVAMLVDAAFLGGEGRHERLFVDRPPSHILMFAEPLTTSKEALCQVDSLTDSYAWLVWMGDMPTRFEWIAPCRKRLERASECAAPQPFGRRRGRVLVQNTPLEAKNCCLLPMRR